MVALPCTLDDWAALGIVGEVHYGQRGKALPYQRRIAQKMNVALTLIAAWWEKVEGHGYVSVSFGKDSLVAWHLAQQVVPDIPAMWVNQGPLAEWPDSLALKDKLVQEHAMLLYEIIPDCTLYAWYRQHGIPVSAAMDSKEDKALNDALMYMPVRRFMHTHDGRGTLWGLRGVQEPYREGLHREILLNKRGLLYKRKDGQWICSPVGRWTTHEIWAYIDIHTLPYPAMYDIDRASIRNGPPLGTSAMNLGRIAMLHQYFPEIYRLVSAHFPRLT